MTDIPPAPEDGEPDSPLDDFLGATPRRGQRQLVSLAVLVLALIAIAALFVRFVTGSDSPYYVAPIEAANFAPRLSEEGIVHGDEELSIRARLDGRLADLPLRSGERADFGQILARIEARGTNEALAAQEAALVSAQADLAGAQVSVEETAARLARFESVWRKSDHRVPSLNEMEQARADAQRARERADGAAAQVEAAKLRIEAERQKARGRVIRAPFAGVVVLGTVRQGQSVVQDMPLLTLVRAGTPLSISVALASRAAMKLKPGATASVRFDDAPDLDVRAVLKRIDTANGERIARFELTGPPGAVRPGMRGRIEVTLDERDNALLVPDAALQFRPGDGERPAPRRDCVYLLGKDGNPRRVFVTLGGSDGGRTEVFSSQLQPGDDVIIGWREGPENTN